MLSTPLENLKHLFSSRPPLTIFVVCLATITLAGFCFAYYIDVADRVVNGDEQQALNCFQTKETNHLFLVFQNWVYFLKYMNRKEYCMERAGDDLKTSDNVLTSDNKVYVPARISFPNGRPDFNSAKGVILIDGIHMIFVFIVCVPHLFRFCRLAVVVPENP